MLLGSCKVHRDRDRDEGPEDVAELRRRAAAAKTDLERMQGMDALSSTFADWLDAASDLMSVVIVGW